MRPYTVVFSTMTVDGRIADPMGFSALSCEADLDLLHSLRAWADAVLVGANTVLRDNPRLNVRRAIGRSPLRVIVDGALKVPPELAALEVEGRAVLATREGHSDRELSRYTSRGIVVIARGAQDVDLRALVEELHDRLGVRRLLVEGGGATSYSMLSRGLVDELWITVAPTAFGGGTPLLDGRGSSLKAALYLKEVRTLCGSWTNLRYGVLEPHYGIPEYLPPQVRI